MSKGKSIRVYDYVNRPYDEVKRALSANAAEVFRNATKSAAGKASSVASELHVGFAGIEVSTDIAITIVSIESSERTVAAPESTRIKLDWEAAEMPRLFPLMHAELAVYPLTAKETQLDLSGTYEPPLGVIGSVIDAAVGHRIAEASVHHFIKDIARYLRNA